MVQHYYRQDLVCSWFHQRDKYYTLEEFKSHMSEEHGSDHR